MASVSLPPAFAVPAYRWYWASQLVSGAGTWAQTVAQAWLVLGLTNSAFALAVITTLQFLPMLVFPLLGGVLAGYSDVAALPDGHEELVRRSAVLLGLRQLARWLGPFRNLRPDHPAATGRAAQLRRILVGP
jgi:hypothetical protein